MEIVRVINVPPGQFPLSRTVIYSLQQLKALLEAEAPAPDRYRSSKSRYESCVKCLNDAGLNFQQEALILLHTGDSSISTKIWVETEYFPSKKLICRLQVRQAEIGLCAMLALCFAVIVQKDKVNQIEVWADNQLLEVFSVE